MGRASDCMAQRAASESLPAGAPTPPMWATDSQRRMCQAHATDIGKIAVAMAKAVPAAAGTDPRVFPHEPAGALPLQALPVMPVPVMSVPFTPVPVLLDPRVEQQMRCQGALICQLAAKLASLESLVASHRHYSEGAEAHTRSADLLLEVPTTRTDHIVSTSIAANTQTDDGSVIDLTDARAPNLSGAAEDSGGTFYLGEVFIDAESQTEVSPVICADNTDRKARDDKVLMDSVAKDMLVNDVINDNRRAFNLVGAAENVMFGAESCTAYGGYGSGCSNSSTIDDLPVDMVTTSTTTSTADGGYGSGRDGSSTFDDAPVNGATTSTITSTAGGGYGSSRENLLCYAAAAYIQQWWRAIDRTRKVASITGMLIQLLDRRAQLMLRSPARETLEVIAELNILIEQLQSNAVAFTLPDS